MATTHDRPIEMESDGAHVTFVKDHPLGLAADPATERPAESKWISAATARTLIAQGYAVESDPAPKPVVVDPQAAVLAKADANGLVQIRILHSGDVFTFRWEIALDRIRKGVAELV